MSVRSSMGASSWPQFSKGLEEYKEAMLKREWWYNVGPDNPYLKRENKNKLRKEARIELELDRIIKEDKLKRKLMNEKKKQMSEGNLKQMSEANLKKKQRREQRKSTRKNEAEKKVATEVPASTQQASNDKETTVIQNAKSSTETKEVTANPTVPTKSISVTQKDITVSKESKKSQPKEKCPTNVAPATKEESAPSKQKKKSPHKTKQPNPQDVKNEANLSSSKTIKDKLPSQPTPNKRAKHSLKSDTPGDLKEETAPPQKDSLVSGQTAAGTPSVGKLPSAQQSEHTTPELATSILKQPVVPPSITKPSDAETQKSKQTEVPSPLTNKEVAAPTSAGKEPDNVQPTKQPAASQQTIKQPDASSLTSNKDVPLSVSNQPDAPPPTNKQLNYLSEPSKPHDTTSPAIKQKTGIIQTEATPPKIKQPVVPPKTEIETPNSKHIPDISPAPGMSPVKVSEQMPSKLPDDHILKTVAQLSSEPTIVLPQKILAPAPPPHPQNKAVPTQPSAPPAVKPGVSPSNVETKESAVSIDPRGKSVKPQHENETLKSQKDVVPSGPQEIVAPPQKIIESKQATQPIPIPHKNVGSPALEQEAFGSAESKQTPTGTLLTKESIPTTPPLTGSPTADTLSQKKEQSRPRRDSEKSKGKSKTQKSPAKPIQKDTINQQQKKQQAPLEKQPDTKQISKDALDKPLEPKELAKEKEPSKEIPVLTMTDEKSSKRKLDDTKQKSDTKPVTLGVAAKPLETKELIKETSKTEPITTKITEIGSSVEKPSENKQKKEMQQVTADSASKLQEAKETLKETEPLKEATLAAKKTEKPTLPAKQEQGKAPAVSPQEKEATKQPDTFPPPKSAEAKETIKEMQTGKNASAADKNTEKPAVSTKPEPEKPISVSLQQSEEKKPPAMVVPSKSVEAKGMQPDKNTSTATKMLEKKPTLQATPEPKVEQGKAPSVPLQQQDDTKQPAMVLPMKFEAKEPIKEMQPDQTENVNLQAKPEQEVAQGTALPLTTQQPKEDTNKAETNAPSKPAETKEIVKETQQDKDAPIAANKPSVPTKPEPNVDQGKAPSVPLQQKEGTKQPAMVVPIKPAEAKEITNRTQPHKDASVSAERTEIVQESKVEQEKIPSVSALKQKEDTKQAATVTRPKSPDVKETIKGTQSDRDALVAAKKTEKSTQQTKPEPGKAPSLLAQQKGDIKQTVMDAPSKMTESNKTQIDKEATVAVKVPEKQCQEAKSDSKLETGKLLSLSQPKQNDAPSKDAEAKEMTKETQPIKGASTAATKTEENLQSPKIEKDKSPLASTEKMECTKQAVLHAPPIKDLASENKMTEKLPEQATPETVVEKGKSPLILQPKQNDTKLEKMDAASKPAEIKETVKGTQSDKNAPVASKQTEYTPKQAKPEPKVEPQSLLQKQATDENIDKKIKPNEKRQRRKTKSGDKGTKQEEKGQIQLSQKKEMKQDEQKKPNITQSTVDPKISVKLEGPTTKHTKETPKIDILQRAQPSKLPESEAKLGDQTAGEKDKRKPPATDGGRGRPPPAATDKKIVKEKKDDSINQSPSMKKSQQTRGKFQQVQTKPQQPLTKSETDKPTASVIKLDDKKLIQLPTESAEKKIVIPETVDHQEKKKEQEKHSEKEADTAKAQSSIGKESLKQTVQKQEHQSKKEDEKNKKDEKTKKQRLRTPDKKDKRTRRHSKKESESEKDKPVAPASVPGPQVQALDHKQPTPLKLADTDKKMDEQKPQIITQAGTPEQKQQTPPQPMTPNQQTTGLPLKSSPPKPLAPVQYSTPPDHTPDERIPPAPPTQMAPKSMLPDQPSLFPSELGKMPSMPVSQTQHSSQQGSSSYQPSFALPSTMQMPPSASMQRPPSMDMTFSSMTGSPTSPPTRLMSPGGQGQQTITGALPQKTANPFTQSPLNQGFPRSPTSSQGPMSMQMPFGMPNTQFNPGKFFQTTLGGTPSQSSAAPSFIPGYRQQGPLGNQISTSTQTGASPNQPTYLTQAEIDEDDLQVPELFDSFL